MARNHILAKIKTSTATRGKKAEREALAAVWPQICEALQKMPPTIGEIESIRLYGPPEGFSFLPKFRPIHRHDFKKAGKRGCRT